jgi:hypothetical protein
VREHTRLQQSGTMKHATCSCVLSCFAVAACVLILMEHSVYQLYNSATNPACTKHDDAAGTWSGITYNLR